MMWVGCIAQGQRSSRSITPTGVNITFLESDLLIRVSENETREVCIVPIQKDFERSIPVHISFMDGSAIGNQNCEASEM